MKNPEPKLVAALLAVALVGSSPAPAFALRQENAGTKGSPVGPELRNTFGANTHPDLPAGLEEGTRPLPLDVVDRILKTATDLANDPRVIPSLSRQLYNDFPQRGGITVAGVIVTPQGWEVSLEKRRRGDGRFLGSHRYSKPSAGSLPAAVASVFRTEEIEAVMLSRAVLNDVEARTDLRAVVVYLPAVLRDLERALPADGPARWVAIPRRMVSVAATGRRGKPLDMVVIDTPAAIRALNPTAAAGLEEIVEVIAPAEAAKMLDALRLPNPVGVLGQWVLKDGAYRLNRLILRENTPSPYSWTLGFEPGFVDMPLPSQAAVPPGADTSYLIQILPDQLLALVQQTTKITRTTIPESRAPSAADTSLTETPSEFHVLAGESQYGGLEEGIEFYATLEEAAAAHPEVTKIEEELTVAGHAPEAMLAIPAQREVVIYATPDAMKNLQVAALRQEAATTVGFERITIRAWNTGEFLPQNAVLLIGEDNTRVLRRGDVVRIPVALATSLNALFSAILQTKLRHEVGDLVIRRSEDLQTTYIFA